MALPLHSERFPTAASGRQGLQRPRRPTSVPPHDVGRRIAASRGTTHGGAQGGDPDEPTRPKPNAIQWLDEQTGQTIDYASEAPAAQDRHLSVRLTRELAVAFLWRR